MKKLILGALILLGVGTAQVNAQTISGGVKADAGMSGLLFKKTPDTKSDLGFGGSAGGFLKLELSENFAIQPELLLQFKNSKLESKSTKLKTDYQYFGLQLPVYALGQFNLGSGKFYAGAGPYIGYGFSAKQKLGGNKIDLYKDKIMKRFDFGAGVLVGYEFSNKIQINAGYKMGFADLNKANGDEETRNHELSLGIGYRF